MSKEEAIHVLEKYTDVESGISKVVAEAHKLAINALEQAPCTDAISREFLLKCIETDCRTKKIPVPLYIIGIIKSALPVKPQPKMGQWIEHKNDDGRSWLECPICHIKKQYPIPNYCPKCGSRNTEKDIPDEDGWVW